MVTREAHHENKDAGPSIAQIQKELKDHDFGFAVVNPNRDPESVEIEGQKVKVPFTNGFIEVLLKKVGGKWEYASFRWPKGDKEKREREIKIAYEVLIKSQG